MSEQDQTDETPSPETEETEQDRDQGSQSSGPTPRVGLQGLLTRDTDIAARPGFRNPSNKRSKAQKKKGRKKKR